MAPPVAKAKPVVHEAHGDRRVDDFAWIRDRDDPDVLALLQAENAYTEAVTAPLDGLRTALFDEIRSRVVETDLSVATRKDGWWYFGRTVEGLDYPIFCRVPVDGAGRDPSVPLGSDAADADLSAAPPPLEHWPDEEVLLDENALAEGHPYLSVGDLEVSPGHRLLAYTVDRSGDERYALHVRDLAAGGETGPVVEDVSYGVAWADDERTLFYTRPDHANRPYQVWRRRIDGPLSEDELVLEEPDERFTVGVRRTKDGAYVVVESHSKVTSEAHVVPAGRPTEALRLTAARRQDVEYLLEHHGGHFLFLTNDDAVDFRLMAAPEQSPGREHWREVVPERAGVRLQGVDVFRRHLACYERVDGSARIRIVPLPDAPSWEGPLPAGELVPGAEQPSTFWGGDNPEFDSAVLRYEYSSLVTPRTVFDLDMAAFVSSGREPVRRKRQRVLGGYDPGAYRTERRWATASDGTRVPISLVRRADTPLDGSAPCLLYGYGAYEISIDPVFSSIRLSLLDRGAVFAIAHVRGGGEMGRRWYEDGKLLAKPHTFTDFLACGDVLVGECVVDGARLVARGGSAGGLLMGAVANLAPERFRAVVAEVPFVDCLTTMLDESLPLTVTEYEEWGNPGADAEVYAVMRSYSPYDNVHPARYPDVLATAGLEDPRVGYWEPAKWVQRLRRADPEAQVLLKTELQAGHGGPSGRYDAWRHEAFVIAFVLRAMELAPAT